MDEQAEADCAAEMAAVGKALGGFDSTALDVIESLGQVKKAGRTLSAANELAIRHAVESLQKVLSSLPAAPEPQESGQQVAKKETDMQPETGTAPDTDTPAVDPIGKADGEATWRGRRPQGAHGRRVRRQGQARRHRPPGPDHPGLRRRRPDEDEPPAAEPEADRPPWTSTRPGRRGRHPLRRGRHQDDRPATGDDVAKATSRDDAATGDDVTKQTPQTTDTVSDVLKSSVTELVKGLLDAHSATQNELITKQSAAILELTDVVEP
ncbi:hypothetical protein [Streptomyces scabiei]|uniref:hypothetical protein n=1 Tax=Streptomyces scabiei TaxID=1930 RepID=UPI001B325A58|nr:hypothetical protein [Streptomyces sp. LBUM 1481]MBP5896438.1 hypothetical protein [Streptomyces sp. LBUM 1481]